MGNTSAETTGGSLENLTDFAWCFDSEVGGGSSYGSQTNLYAKCKEWGYDEMIDHDYNKDDWDKKDFGYYGRGALQITHCYNYAPLQKWSRKNLSYPADKTNFMTHPSLVATADFGFAGSVWYYMSASREHEKPSMHSVVDYWVLPNGEAAKIGDLPVDNSGRVADFGYTMNILNGGYKCNGKPHPGPAKRVGYMGLYLTRLGVNA